MLRSISYRDEGRLVKLRKTERGKGMGLTGEALYCSGRGDVDAFGDSLSELILFKKVIQG